MTDNIHKFRRVKWGDPVKLKVLAEDLKARPRITSGFAAVVAFLFLVAFAATYLW